MPQVVAKPDHIPDELVRDFDFAHPPGMEDGVYAAWKRLHDGPDIFWTPHYGGHWVATRAEDIETIQKDYQRFSHEVFSLPREAKPLRFLPLEVDPPVHEAYRKVISPPFTPKAIAKLEGVARELAIRLIEGFKAKGRCEFVSDFSRHLPVTVFLGIADLPLERREQFISWADAAARGGGDLELKKRAFGEAFAYLSKVIDERTANPGQDLLSEVVHGKINGREPTREERLGMGILLFFGGIDTVASMLSFIALFLATHPEHRKQLVQNPQIVPQAVEELLRRHGLSNTLRLITQDFEYKGIPFKKGDLIQVPISLHGLDERRWERPLEVDFNRKTTFHATFGNGPHRCPGSNLARTEIRVFLQEWMARIPDFTIAKGEKVVTATGSVNAVEYLPLEWRV